jgi:FkbM family methyltransferase
MLRILLEKLHDYSLIDANTGRFGFVIKKLMQRLIRFICKYYDPEINIRVGNRVILAPLSHNLSNLLSEYPHYDTALPRIAEYINNFMGNLTMIDVGANIGDSVTIVEQKVQGKFLCIEPSSKYFPYLVKNTSKVKGAVVENVGAGEFDTEIFADMDEHRGSMRLRTSSTNTLSIIKIDSLLKYYPDFKNANLLKIDTDGFDYKTIRGAAELLNNFHPFIYFELSPDHMLNVGNEDLMSIFPFLNKLGYEHLFFYDQHGYPIAPVSISETATIEGILGYAHRKPNYWLDVLAVHKSQKEFFSEFVDSEYKIIPIYSRPYFLAENM